MGIRLLYKYERLLGSDLIKNVYAVIIKYGII